MDAGGHVSLVPCRVLGAFVAMLMGITIGSPSALPADTLDYTVSVAGVKSSALKNSIIGATGLLDEPKRPVPTIRALRRRVEASRPRITALLRARAYYAAKHDFRIDRKSENSAEVIFDVKLGPVYRIGRYEIQKAEAGAQPQTIDIPFETLELKPGDRARSEVVTAADARVLAALGRRAYPLAKIDNRRVVVDHRARTMSVYVTVSTGPSARFGETRTEGLQDVLPELIQKNIYWKRGEPFDSDLLDKVRSRLRQTGLFTSVVVRHAEQVDSQGEVAMIVSVTERKHRSIGAGGSYSTTEGLLGKLFWEHRNLWGNGERLKLRGEVGEIRQGAFGDLRFPNLGARDQDLVFDARALREQPEGFESIETGASTRLERRFGSIYAGSAGVGFEHSNIEENNAEENFTFLTFPLSLRRDTADDLLDPGEGSRASLTFTPNIGIVGTDTSFYDTTLFDTVYFPLMADKKLILAGWGRLGAIFGDSTSDIPANKRRYSGGPGSVRGYALNSIGPLDASDDPVGGRSSTEFGAELRWRAIGPVGFVTFVEAGGVYDGTVPDWGKNLQWGAGLGARYYTKIGPLRLDVAVPLNRRNAVDDSFQILVSLGQAF